MTETLVSGMVSAETKCTGFGQNQVSGVSVVSAYPLMYGRHVRATTSQDMDGTLTLISGKSEVY